MVSIDAVIFDCFGVLYPAHVDNYFERHKNLFTDSSDLLDTLYSQIDLGQISQAEFYRAIEEKAQIPASEIQAEMEAELIASTKLIRLITELKKTYKIGLLSNAGQEEISIIYRDKIDHLFDAIAVSYEVGDIKPNPKIFTTCLDRLDSSAAQSIFVDDSLKNLDGTRRLGMRTIHYENFDVIPKELVGLASQN